MSTEYQPEDANSGSTETSIDDCGKGECVRSPGRHDERMTENSPHPSPEVRDGIGWFVRQLKVADALRNGAPDNEEDRS
jgi:hypothetical protein